MGGLNPSSGTKSRRVAQQAEHTLDKGEVAGSTPAAPTKVCAGVAYWLGGSLPSYLNGFDSHHPLRILRACQRCKFQTMLRESQCACRKSFLGTQQPYSDDNL